MTNRYLSIVIIGLTLMGSFLQPVSVRSRTSNEIQKIKSKVNARGTGEKAKVVVLMKDGRRMRGHIRQATADSFELTISGTDGTVTVPYAEVAQVKKQGWSTMAKLALGAGIGAGVVIVIVGVAVSKGLGDFCPLGCLPN